MASNTGRNVQKELNNVVRNDIKNGDAVKINSKQKHSLRFLENFKNLLDQNSFCDVDLIAVIDGTKISVHRLVLIASSKYFSAMFASGMAESDKMEIKLHDIAGEALQLLINYCYTGEIEITAGNVELLLPAASQLEFVEIEEECSKFLECFLEKNPLNCISYYAVAELYDFADLMKLSMQLMCKHFTAIKITQDFLEIKPQLLFKLIASNDLNVEREEEVFGAVNSWINYDQNARAKHTVDLFKDIRFTLMEFSFLTEHVVKLLMSLGLQELYVEVLNFKYDANNKPKSIPEHLLLPRNSSQIQSNLIAFLVENGGLTLYKATFNNAFQQESEPINLQMGNIYAMVNWKTCWYVFNETGQIVCIDVISLVVTSIPDVPKPLKGYAVVVHNDCIYVVAVNLEHRKSETYIDGYRIPDKKWFISVCVSLFSNYASSIVATILNNAIYYAANTNTTVSLHSFDLNSQNKNVLPLPINRNPVTQVTSYDGHLYIANSYCIQRYNTLTRIWDLVYNQPISSILSNQQSDEIFIVEYNSNHLVLKKFSLAEHKWVDCGMVPRNKILHPALFVFENN